ncbi:MAG: acyl-CoA/acyl-ACP dehydrogenase [Alphaproteobacteria bacterium]|nr:acyl-CoA/acyl-ACP dehydrogenase [Alphaproteobacteria bacterium]MBU1515408.1 acyl-CoA/acyl-ACP dehydrogenase [Alphaproteobacteria bacterium]MBU2092957.1 acyl-CoA/acyl-ACP dehydrogenase [Alphaproteobacteria bacterium]MBU2153589.1 acyl-CoA/acyl-ACP dehydrogenase [Alphaproteobacteria bacterium]MBU2309902.1 acyl-CoA/acyl-ACP dehydrogenase [Alphaproteobacteria bacterium]
MDMQLNELQQQISDACGKILERRAGPGRARALRAAGDFDRLLLTEMAEAGFLDLFGEPEAGPLVAALITQWGAQAAALAPIGIRGLVAPSVIHGDLPEVIAIAEQGAMGAVRYGAEADMLIVLDGDEARVARRGEFKAETIKSKFGYPIARITEAKGEALAPGAGAIARRWWRVAIAAEISGSARGAVDLTIRYMGDRVQFDRPIATYQALQHRIVECHVSTDAATWATREAAFRGAPVELAATAAIIASEAAHRVFFETHQLTGAMGFTTEYDLHLYTMRLQTLRLEMQGLRAHARDLIDARWSAAS